MKKKVIAISLSAFIIFLSFGGLIAVSSRADNPVSVPFLAKNTNGFDSTNITDATFLYRTSNRIYYAGSSVQCKVARYGNNGIVYGAPENAYIDWGSYRTDNNSVSMYADAYCGNIYDNIVYYTFTNVGVTVIEWNAALPVFPNIESALYAMNNGVWEDAPPVDPEYQFDINIGGLKNVSWKQVAVPSTNETLLEVSYDQYTTTGVNMMNSGMGVAIRYQAYNSIDSVNPFWKSEAYFADVYDVIDVTMQWLIGPDAINANRNIGSVEVDPFSGGGGGHSFSSPADFSGGGGGHDIVVNNEVYYIDLVLTPYYYDGTDYYYGYNTSINKVYFDYVGTRLIPTENEFQNTDTYLNNGSTNTYYYDYGISADYIDNSTNFYYYTTNNVFNYTGVTDDPTEITFNDIDNSTENVYNFTGIGSIPDLDIDGFNISPAQIINNLKGVIVALVVASPVLMGLFDFLPYWAINIAVACCITVAVICVVRIFRIGGGGTT